MNFWNIFKIKPMFLVVRLDTMKPVGAYYSRKDALNDCSELNEDSMFSGQPSRKYQVMHWKHFKYLQDADRYH